MSEAGEKVHLFPFFQLLEMTGLLSAVVFSAAVFSPGAEPERVEKVTLSVSGTTVETKQQVLDDALFPWAGPDGWTMPENLRAPDARERLQVAIGLSHIGRWAEASDVYRSFIRDFPLASELPFPEDAAVNAHAAQVLTSLGWCLLLSGDLWGAEEALAEYRGRFPDKRFDYNSQRLEFFIGFRYFQAAAKAEGQEILEDWFTAPSGGGTGGVARGGTDARQSIVFLALMENLEGLPESEGASAKAQNIFNTLVSTDPHTVFKDKALFCTGLLHAWNLDIGGAVSAFERVIAEEASSPLVPYAEVECAAVLVRMRITPRYNSEWDAKAERYLYRAARKLAGAVGAERRRIEETAEMLRSRKAQRKLGRADFYLANGDIHAAEIALEEIVSRFRDTPEAEKARRKLKKLHRR